MAVRRNFKLPVARNGTSQPGATETAHTVQTKRPVGRNSNGHAQGVGVAVMVTSLRDGVSGRIH